MASIGCEDVTIGFESMRTDGEAALLNRCSELQEMLQAAEAMSQRRHGEIEELRNDLREARNDQSKRMEATAVSLSDCVSTLQSELGTFVAVKAQTREEVTTVL